MGCAVQRVPLRIAPAPEPTRVGRFGRLPTVAPAGGGFLERGIGRDRGRGGSSGRVVALRACGRRMLGTDARLASLRLLTPPSPRPPSPVPRTGVPDVISQSVALIIADAIARNSTATASDLIFQALIRQTAAQTTALTLNAMIQEVGCMEPLVEALVGASTIAEETSDMVIWPLALRGISADVSYLAQCLAIIGY